MQGQLFSQDFLTRGVLDAPPWQALDTATFNHFESTLRSIYEGLSVNSTIKVFFPDAHASFKFCALIFGRQLRHPARWLAARRMSLL